MSEADLIEILAEYIQKTDRILDKMQEHDKIFEKQFNRLDISYQMIVSHSEKIEYLQQQTKDIQEEIKQIWEESRELNKKILVQQEKNDILLTEILSISKRVDSIEHD